MSIFNTADILLPKNCDMTKWSVVACDQYTSEPLYWKKVEETADRAPSCLNIIFPEAYLSELDFDSKIKEVNNTMKEYLDNDIFTEYKDALIFVRRTFPSGEVRSGLIGAVDLEEYDYSALSSSPIRATEATVPERIPPRVAIRRNAPLELPHILLLIDDEKDSVIGPLKSAELKKLYDFELMQDGGHIEGYLVNNNDAVLKAIHGLNKSPLIAVGDGNHSLASAKACWEEIKKTLPESVKENHPARYALCEVVNLHEKSLVFEPIHRVLFSCNPAKVTASMKEQKGKFTHKINFVTKEKSECFDFQSDCHLQSGAVSLFLDDYVSKYGGKVDYVHGDDTAESFGKQDGNIAFLIKCLRKEDLFDTVNAYGPLPKKTFSMGHANEKRFYTEARKIVR
ncbi:MAG: DUF1015 domain-containing protein [Bacillota bacterium]|nr:DUF1015 domain-containing protein [Bacillota bacterium]